MKSIEIVNEPNFDNNAFIDEVQTINDTIFGTDSVCGYLLSEDTDVNTKKLLIETNEITPFQKAFNNLGTTEKKIINCLKSSERNLCAIAYIGDRGSGKSSVLKFTHDWLIKNGEFTDDFEELKNGHSSLITKIDINNEVGEYEDGSEMVESIQIQLYKTIKMYIGQIYNNTDLINAFIDFILAKSLQSPWNNFYDFVEDIIKNPAEQWHLLDFKDKRRKLLAWINGIDNRSYQYTLFRFLIKYYLEIFRDGQKKNLIILFDNVDNLHTKYQGKFLISVLQLSHDTSLKVLVSMRHTTFGTIDGAFAFTYVSLEHKYISPVYIIKKRIKHFLDNHKNEGPYKDQILKISEANLNYYIRRLEAFYLFLENGKRTNTLLNAISGVSIRKALLIAQRIVNTSIIKFSTRDFSEDMSSQILLVSPALGIRISSSDKYITNMFSSEFEANGLIKLRILDYLNQVHQKNNARSCYVGQLLSHLRLFEQFTDEEIFYAVRDLMLMRKRLIYVPGVEEYTDERNFFQSNHDIIKISSSGIGYFKEALHDLQYLQNATYSISWTIDTINKNKEKILSHLRISNDCNPTNLTQTLINTLEIKKKLSISDYIPNRLDDSSIVDRLSFLRGALGVFLLEDLYQTSNFIQSNQAGNFTLERLLVGEIIMSAANSIERIYKSVNALEEEIRNWNSLKIEVGNWNNVIFPQTP